jgi:ABC-2 type transport system ATP-binding protein
MRAAPEGDLDAAAGNVVVELDSVTKEYRGRAVVKDLSLTVRRGEVFAFLGPNGAGKTTTIRMLLALARPTRGVVKLFGRIVPREFLAVAPRLAALPERPSFEPHMSGEANLEVLARLSGPVARARVAECLDRVGLASAAKQKAGEYSLGMRQRLGLAQALLGKPELLVLDEPTNGLDPREVQSFRATVRDLAAGGTTVFLSSHLLFEVEQVSSRVAILEAGRLVVCGTVEALLSRAEPIVLVRAEPIDRALAFLAADPLCRSVTRGNGDGLLRVAARHDAVPELARRLVGAGLSIRELTPIRPSLEDLFLAHTRASATETNGANEKRGIGERTS